MRSTGASTGNIYTRAIPAAALALALMIAPAGCGSPSVPAEKALGPGIIPRSASADIAQTGAFAPPSPAAAALEGPREFRAKYFSSGWSSETVYPVVTLLRSKEELDSCFSDYHMRTRICEEAYEYDEAYFKDNVLIDVMLATGSGSNRFKVTSLHAKKSGLFVTIACLIPEMGTCDMAAWHVLIETGKAGLPNDNVYVSTYSAKMSCEADHSELWAVSLADEGFTRSGASRTILWEGEDARMVLSIQPAEYAVGPPGDGKPAMLNGREYRIYEGAFYWDIPGSCGMTRQKGIVWESGGLWYKLYAETDSLDAPLEFISPETAEKLEATPGLFFEGYSLKSDIWGVEYTNGGIALKASLTSFNSTLYTIDQDIHVGDYEKVTESGVTYYSRAIKGSFGRDSSKTVYWRANCGRFTVSAEILPSYPGESFTGALDFVNAGLIKTITEQMGGRVVQTDDSVFTAY